MENGVWRTIAGRRVFIKKGQSLSDAMKSSGKFEGGKVKSTGNKEADKKVDDLAKEYTEKKDWSENRKGKEGLSDGDIQDILEGIEMRYGIDYEVLYKRFKDKTKGKI